jgi:hypothetical protein
MVPHVSSGGSSRTVEDAIMLWGATWPRPEDHAGEKADGFYKEEEDNLEEIDPPLKVRVDWDDAIADNGWYARHELKGTPKMECQTRGWMTKRCKRYVLVAQTIGTHEEVDQFMNWIAIPTGCIREIHTD